MDLELTSADIEFRDSLPEVFLGEIPAGIRRRSALNQTTHDDIVTSQRILNSHGLAEPHWPTEWGGRGWTATQSHIYEAEMQRALKTRLLVLEATQLRVTGASENGQASPVSSLLKMEGTQTLQELTRLRMSAAGSDGAIVDAQGDLVADPAATASAAQYLNLRKLSIFGGSNEIQRGVIAKTILGL